MFRFVVKLPIAALFDAGVLENQGMGGRQFFDSAETALRAEQISQREVLIDSGGIGLGPHRRMSQQSFHFRSKDQMTAVEAIVERLFAEAIASEEQTARAFIPNREGKRASQLIDASRAEFFIEMKDDFSVGARTEAMPAFLEPRAHLGVIVNLAVTNHVHRLIFIDDR